MAIDTNKICTDHPIEDVIGEYVQLIKNGKEFQACCPFHDEKTPSFSVSPQKGFFHCFGCGAHGDQIDFIEKYHNITFKQACDVVSGGNVPKSASRTKKAKRTIAQDPYHGIKVITPIPDKIQGIKKGVATPMIYNPKRKDDPKKETCVYKPNMVFKYFDPKQNLIGYVLRIDLGNGVKITPTVCWCELPNGTKMYSHIGFPEPRQLYGSENLIVNMPILIVEGEKAADAAKRLMGNDYICVTWPGGTHGRHKVDWSVFQNRRVLIWPDNDAPGMEAIYGSDDKDTHKKGVAEYIYEAGAEVIKIIQPDKKKKKGWDAADAEDEGMKRDDVIAWAKNRIEVFKKVVQEEAPPLEEQLHEYEHELMPAETYDEYNNKEAPFRILGHDRKNFYYLPDRSQQVIELSAQGHTKNNLLILAPLIHWEAEFGMKKGYDVDMAVNALISKCYKQGLFNPANIRGRGIWLDDGRSILHMGRKCYVDGKETDPKEIDSSFIYEKTFDLQVGVGKPATNKEAHCLVDICSSLSWEDSLSGALLAGWCVIAPVCGILPWRPHIWITGESGSGKTTVVKDIIGRVIGSMALNLEGQTTEAGIRQELARDARPIVFDEAEAENKDSAKRMQSILDLARVASSGGRIVKGTRDGGSISYSIRSCFCFSSINTSVQHYADESRIHKLVMKKDKSENAEAKYKELNRKIIKTFTNDYSAAMLARSIKHLKTLQKNCDVFIDAATTVFKSRRLADQVGTILAGYYLCHSTKEITPEEAEAWMMKHEWSHADDLEDCKDEKQLLDYICTYRVRVEDKSKFHHNLSIGELILCASGDMKLIDNESADNELKRNGILVDFEHVYFANNCQPMKKILRGTPWSSNWSRPLKTLAGDHELSTKTKYFSPGIKSRAVAMPMSLFTEGKLL